MLAKTDKGKEIRKYYVKLENIYNEIIKEEIESQKILLEIKDNEITTCKKESLLHRQSILIYKYKDFFYKLILNTRWILLQI